MQRTASATPRILGPVLDLITITITWYGMVELRTQLRGWWSLDIFPGEQLLQHLVVGPHQYLGLFTVPAWLIALHYTRTYDDLRRLTQVQILRRLLKATLLASLLMSWGIFAMGIGSASRVLLLTFPLASLVVLFVTRLWMRHWMERSGVQMHNILLIGDDQSVADFSAILGENLRWGIRAYAYLSQGESTTELAGIQRLGGIEDLPRVLEEEPIHQVLLTGIWTDLSQLRQAGAVCEELGVELSMDANLLRLGLARPSIESLEGMQVLSYRSTPDSGEAMLLKRLFDIAASGAGLLALSPLLLVTAALIKLEDPAGPVFFGQKRSGLYGESFTMWKFRSMVSNAEELKAALMKQNEMDGPVFKIKRDPRITRVGGFIRKFSIDELPQLWNVFTGEMSLVGPRPPLPSEVAQYERWQMRRLSMRPGVTCIWQVSGRNNIDFETWMRLDLEYIDNWSLTLDLRLLLKTIPVVLLGSGAS